MSAAESPGEIVERLAKERAAGKERPPVHGLVHIAITGGRDRTPTQPEMAVFWKLWVRLKGDILHEGGAKGTDAFVGAEWTARTGREPIRHLPDWDAYGKAAGPFRNKAMMTQCSALIAFLGGRGTESCIRAAKEQGKPVYFVIDELADSDRAGLKIPASTAGPAGTRTPGVCACGAATRATWTYWPRWAAWRGACSLCNTTRWATGAEAAILEREVEEYCERTAARPDA